VLIPEVTQASSRLRGDDVLLESRLVSHDNSAQAPMFSGMKTLSVQGCIHSVVTGYGYYQGDVLSHEVTQADPRLCGDDDCS